MEVDRNKVNRFWEEFSVLSQEIIKSPDNNKVIERVDYLVKELGGYDWEYGPSEKGEYYFCLSPNLQEELLKKVDEIVSLAPVIYDWEIISGKPRKKEFLKGWTMFNEDNTEILVDTDNWKCVVYKFPDNTYDIDFKISGVEGNEDTQYLAVDIHLTNLLGERNYLRLIKGVNIVPEFSKEAIGRTVMVKDLTNYISPASQ